MASHRVYNLQMRGVAAVVLASQVASQVRLARESQLTRPLLTSTFGIISFSSQVILISTGSRMPTSPPSEPSCARPSITIRYPASHCSWHTKARSSSKKRSAT